MDTLPRPRPQQLRPPRPHQDPAPDPVRHSATVATGLQHPGLYYHVYYHDRMKAGRSHGAALLESNNCIVRQRRDGRVAEGARLESVFTRKGNVGSNPTLSASSFGMVYEYLVVLACNGVQRASNAAWPSTSIDATARNVKAPTPKIPAPDNLKRDGAAGKNARA